MLMRSLLTVFVSAIMIMAWPPSLDAADDVTLVKASTAADVAREACGGEDTGQPACESPEGEGLAPEPDDFRSEKRQDQCLPSLNCRACPRVYADVEALLLEQVPLSQNRPVVVDANTGRTFLLTSDLNSGFDPGLRATFGVRPCNGLALEFSYFGLFQSGSALTEKPDASSYLIFPGNFAGNVFVNMNQVQTDYVSSVKSFELNLPWCCGCCSDCGCSNCGCGEATFDECGCAKAACGAVRCRSLAWFAGIHYLDIGNKLNLAVQRNEAGGVENGAYDIHTANHLIGGQIGARLRSTVNRFGWEMTGKAGIYANDAEQTQSVIDFPNFPLRPSMSAYAGTTAFEGEINFSGIYRLTDVWSVKAGYNLIWVEDLALATDQLDFNFATSPSGNQLHPGGGLFLYGANVGLEARW